MSNAIGVSPNNWNQLKKHIDNVHNKRLNPFCILSEKQMSNAIGVSPKNAITDGCSTVDNSLDFQHLHA